MKTVECEMCGNEFITRNNTRYCNDCKKEIRNERYRRRAVTKRLGMKKYNHDALDKNIRDAAAAGMSYGKFTAMKRMKGA